MKNAGACDAFNFFYKKRKGRDSKRASHKTRAGWLAVHRRRDDVFLCASTQARGLKKALCMSRKKGLSHAGGRMGLHLACGEPGAIM